MKTVRYAPHAREYKNIEIISYYIYIRILILNVIAIQRDKKKEKKIVEITFRSNIIRPVLLTEIIF